MAGVTVTVISVTLNIDRFYKCTLAGITVYSVRCYSVHWQVLQYKISGTLFCHDGAISKCF
jgi:hypothetical protein